MEHKGSIILETERLILRPLSEKDDKEMFNNWANDDEVSKYVRWSTHKNIEETREYLKEEEEKLKSKEYYNWGIVLKENGELIGAIGAFLSEDDRYETGYNIARKYWRKGYTTEALKGIIEFLSKDIGIKKFRCSHAILNPASGAVMKKAGFRYVKNDYYEKFDKSIGYESKVYYLDTIKLIEPTKEYEKQALEYKKEHFENGEKIIHACSRWDKIDNYDEWLKLLKIYSSLETIKDDWTVHTNFLGIREYDNKLVGMIDIRHELTNDLLRNYVGHIGYSVRPSERKKGYATQMLKQALSFCKDELKLKEVMISCDKENQASKKTIINAGGVLEREYVKNDGEIVDVHWIKLL